MAFRIAVVVKDDIRHRVFLRLAINAFCTDHRLYVFMHSLEAVDNEPQSQKQVLLRHFRRIRKLGTRFSKKGQVDWKMKAFLNIKPVKDYEIPDLHKTFDLNAKRNLEILRKVNPDLIIVFGAPILKENWVTLPRLGALNMHYGMLPWYRSGNSTQFALLHERIDRIGPTIHYIDKGVDTGAIVNRYPVSLRGYSSVSELLAAVYAEGAIRLIENASESLRINSKLPSVIELSENSFYPAKFGTPDVLKGAELRMREIDKWPHTQMVIERISLHRPKPWQFRLPVKAPNGVYILLYHGLTDPSNMELWEKSYDRVSTHTHHFVEQIEFLIREGFVPLPITDAPEVLRRGSPNKRYFVVTFDDGYNNIKVIQSVLKSKGIRPTVFVNGSFCRGIPYYRILSAMLRDHVGGTQTLQYELKSRAPQVEWSMDPEELFNQTKDEYIVGVIEDAVTEAYRAKIGRPEELGCHLDAEALYELEKAGWQIGNHTWEHRTLSALTDIGVREAIERNSQFLGETVQKPIDWLSYPNGLGRHVNGSVKKWLDEHPYTNGVFAGGGVNLIASRTQWLRISVANPSLSNFKRQLRQSVFASVKALDLAHLGKSYL